MANIGLTSAQKQAYDFILSAHSRTGIPPSYDELRQELGLKSKSGVYRIIMSLCERGYIKKLAHRARSLTPIPQTFTSDREIVALADIKELAERAHFGEIPAQTAISGIMEVFRTGVRRDNG